MFVGEIIVYLGLILSLITILTKLFLIIVKKEFKIYVFLLKIALGLFLGGGAILALGRIFGF